MNGGLLRGAVELVGVHSDNDTHTVFEQGYELLGDAVELAEVRTIDSKNDTPYLIGGERCFEMQTN